MNTTTTDNDSLMSWDDRFLRQAISIAEWSKINTTKVGCLLVRPDKTFIVGYNGPPRGYPDEEISAVDRSRLRNISTHAEANAISNAARTGFCTIGTTAYVTHPPCSQCMSQLINAGIERVIYREKDLHDDWSESMALALDIAIKCGIEVIGCSDKQSEKEERGRRLIEKGKESYSELGGIRNKHARVIRGMIEIIESLTQ